MSFISTPVILFPVTSREMSSDRTEAFKVQVSRGNATLFPVTSQEMSSDRTEAFKVQVSRGNNATLFPARSVSSAGPSTTPAGPTQTWIG